MAISRFSNPATYNPLTTYVSPDFETIRNNLAIKQHQYDVNKEDERSFLEKLASVKARSDQRRTGGSDLEDLRKISSIYESGLNNIVDSVHKDYGSSDFQNKFHKLKSTLHEDLTKGNLYAIHSNYLNKQAYDKQVSELKDNYHPYLDKQYPNIAEGQYAGFRNPDGTLNIVAPGAIDKHIDRPKAADEIVKGINSIGGASVKFTKDENGNDIITTQSGERITGDKIRGAFRPAFANSEASQQINKEADHNQVIAQRTGQPFDRNAFVQNAVKDLEDSMVSKYTMSKGTAHASIDRLPEYQSDKNTTPIYSPTRNGAAFTNPNAGGTLVDPTKFTFAGEINSQFDKYAADNGFQGIKRDGLFAYGKPRINGVEVSEAEYSKRYKELRSSFNNQIKADYNNHVKTQVNRINQSGLDHFDPKDRQSYITAYNKAIKDIKNVTLPGEQIAPEQIKVYKDLLDANASNALYNVGGEQLNINQIAKKYGVKPSEIQITPNLIHYDSVDPNQPGGGLEVSIHIKGDKHDEVVPAFTILNNNFTAATQIVSEIGQNSIYRGSDKYTENDPKYDPSTNSNIYTITSPKKQYVSGKTLPFNTQVVIEPLDKNGNPTDKIKMSYQKYKEHIADYAREKLFGVINSSQSTNSKDIKKK